MNNKKTKRLIENCFLKVTQGNHYDLEEATRHQSTSGIFDMTVCDAVEEVKKFIKFRHLGCCLHYSIYLTSILEDFGIEARLATIPDDDENGTRTNLHACVWFMYDDEEYIADPVKALDDENGWAFCFIPLKEYMKTYLHNKESLSIYPPLNAEFNNKLFSSFLFTPERETNL